MSFIAEHERAVTERGQGSRNAVNEVPALTDALKMLFAVGKDYGARRRRSDLSHCVGRFCSLIHSIPHGP